MSIGLLVHATSLSALPSFHVENRDPVRVQPYAAFRFAIAERDDCFLRLAGVVDYDELPRFCEPSRLGADVRCQVPQSLSRDAAQKSARCRSRVFSCVNLKPPR